MSDLYTTLPGRDDGETAGVHIGCTGDRPEPKETEMTNTENKLIGSRRKSLTTMLAALLAGSLVATAGGFAYAKTDGQAFDPAKFQQRIEKRVDKALTGTDATVDQKKKVADILEAAFKDMKPLHDQRVENRKAMEDAHAGPDHRPGQDRADPRRADEGGRRTAPSASPRR